MSCFLQSFELERVVVRVARSRAPARHFLPRAVSAMEAELTCPITGEIFLRPALLVGDGHTYERAGGSDARGREIGRPGRRRVRARKIEENRTLLSVLFDSWHFSSVVTTSRSAREPRR